MRQIQKEIVKNLVWSSAGYGRTGLALFRDKPGFYRNSQVAIGNLAIAIELLLKGYIGKKHFLILLKEVPLELKCALVAPEALPASFKKAPHEIELRSSRYKSIGFNDVISAFGVFCLELKQRLNAHFKFLIRCRDVSLHAALPEFHEYELERTVFLYLTLINHIKKEEPDLLKHVRVGDLKENEKFLKQFDEERLNRVHVAIEKAKEKAKRIESKSSVPVDSWEVYPVRCPVCQSDGLLSGETELGMEPDEYEKAPIPILTFFGDSFECEDCGLMLNDYDELEIAGIDTAVDRTHDLSKWEDEFYSDYYDHELG